MLLRLRFRNWLREKLQAEIKAGPGDRAFLDKQPWLKQMLPLGTSLREGERGRIKVQKVDADVLFGDFTYHGVYLVHEDGTILTKAHSIITTGWFGTIREAEPVYRAFRRLGDQGNLVKYVVVVDSDGFLFLPGCARVTIYKLPKEEAATVFIARLTKERQDNEAQRERTAREQETLAYEEGRSVAERLRS